MGQPYLLSLRNAFHGNRNRGDLGTNLAFELVGDFLVRLEELFGLFPALAEAEVVVREPGAGLGRDVRGAAAVKQAALTADALAVHHVEFRNAERRRDLVLDHLDADAATNGV